MRRSLVACVMGAAVLALLAAGCGGAAQATPDRIGTQVAEARAVAATLTALAPTLAPMEAAVAPGTTVPPAPPDTAAPSPGATTTLAPPATAQAGPTQTPGPAVPCTVQSAGLRLRRGPGTVYEPSIATVAAGAGLIPLAFNPQGYPDGQWLQVTVVGTGLTGWVSAAPQLVTCTINVADLPPGAAPPTPTAGATPVPPTPTITPSPTPAPIAFYSVPVAGERTHLNKESGLFVPETALAKQNPLTFRGEVVFEMRGHDPRAGGKNGDGIDSVEFIITDTDAGDAEVARQPERNAAFCSFGGGSPCQPWVFRDHDGKWPRGQKLDPGHQYHIEVNIKPQGLSWSYDFRVQ